MNKNNNKKHNKLTLALEVTSATNSCSPTSPVLNLADTNIAVDWKRLSEAAHA